MIKKIKNGFSRRKSIFLNLLEHIVSNTHKYHVRSSFGLFECENKTAKLKRKNMVIYEFCHMLPLSRDLLLMVYKKMCATLKYFSN